MRKLYVNGKTFILKTIWDDQATEVYMNGDYKGFVTFGSKHDEVLEQFIQELSKM